MICESALLQNVSVLENNSDGDVTTNEGGFSLVVDEHGWILDIGADDVISRQYEGTSFEHEIDATGKCVIPGIIHLLILPLNCTFICITHYITLHSLYYIHE